MKDIQRYYPQKSGNFIYLLTLFGFLFVLVFMFFYDDFSLIHKIFFFVSILVLTLIDIVMTRHFFRNSIIIGQHEITGHFITDITSISINPIRIELPYVNIKSTCEIWKSKYKTGVHLIECTKLTEEKIYLGVTPFSKHQVKEILQVLNANTNTGND